MIAWFRIIGICCILAACVLAGLELEQGMRKRWEFFRELKELFDFLEKEMVFHRTPLAEALSEAGERCAGEAGRLLRNAAARAGERDGTSFEVIWESAARECGLKRMLREQEYRLVVEASRALCNADTVMQRTLLEKYRGRFEAMSAEREREYREKGSLYRKLTAAAGVFLALVLL